KKEYAENMHSRDPRRAWHSGVKALQGYKACCLTSALLLPGTLAGDQNQENSHRQFSQIYRIQ
ncbi:hypothetical protein, partial [Klebsiella pneumoniae]|uniref:hypothetical protein n=1 Tax=Klebsiella pneumoniae TaxID=573 RepID=UPI001C0EB708